MRPRKTDRHLPPCVYLRHGAYYLVRRGKWTRLAADLPEALKEYARLHAQPSGGMAALIEGAMPGILAGKAAQTVTETLRKQPESSASAGDQPARCPIRNATSVTLQAAPLLGRFCSIGRAHRGDHSSSLTASPAQASAVRRSIADDSPGLGS